MKFYSRLSVFVIIIFSLFNLTACSGGKPENAVTDYLTALVKKDASNLSTLSCADWEPDALLELDSFQAVTVRMEDLACEKTGTDGDISLVLCQGKIIATYNNEDMEINLATRTYKVIEQGGDFLVCGVQ